MTTAKEQAEIKRQAYRLSTLHGPALDKYGLQEFTETLTRCCKSLDHVRSTVDSVIESCSQRPAPAEVAAVAAQVAGQAETVQRNCPHCKDHRGYRYVWILRTWEHGAEGSRVINTRLTREQAADLLPKVGYKIGDQSVIECVEACPCRSVQHG